MKPMMSVVIPNYNGASRLECCLQSLMRQTYSRMEVLVVDNASSDRSIELIQRVAPRTRIISLDTNLGFAGAVNRGIREAQGEWIAVLNNDTEAAPDWLTECADAIERHPDASFLACRILDYNDRGLVYSAGDCFLRAGIGYRRGQEQPDGEEYDREIPIFSACGCAALYRRTELETAGGFEERFFAYLEDVELGLRFQLAGARGYYVPGARIFHVGGATSGGEFSPLSVRLRTRNSLLLLLKSVPGRILLRSCLMIAVGQAFWFGRVLVHGRLLSYLRGLAGTVRLTPAMFISRRRLSKIRRNSVQQIRNAILESEKLVRRDCERAGSKASHFLRWYFRLFKV